MSADLQPPNIEISAASALDEKDRLRSGTRTPRPYQHDGLDIQQDFTEGYSVRAEDKVWTSGHSKNEVIAGDRWSSPGARDSVAESESGTEADDERPDYLKALPAPRVRLRKGLKTGEKSEDVLLTPSQLDDEGRWRSKDYFQRSDNDECAVKEAQNAEQERLLRIRLAEFARRSSEVGLVAVIILCVLCGSAVLQVASQWRRELVTHLAIVAALVLVYPVKLSIVDSTSQVSKVWQRFRVPASFDPATVLYPPVLPVLVALANSTSNSALILPNVILGLSSLPQRLFPRSSRLGGINVLHWFVSIVPLILSEYTAWPFKAWLTKPYGLKCASATCLLPETLVLLYPLHHALLVPLHYLTTTSLLISELHLLSVALINLLLFAETPQTIILKACLWIGGSLLFLLCAPVLNWSVTLMRVPKWKFRRSKDAGRMRKSLVDAVSDLIDIQRTSVAFRSHNHEDSDADEDEPNESFKTRLDCKPVFSLSNLAVPVFESATEPESRSAKETSQHVNGAFPKADGFSRYRRNTMPTQNSIITPEPRTRSRHKGNATSMPWCLHLTVAQASRRKWLYAGYVYLSIAAVILIPVRFYVLEKALQGQEPIGWALSYLFGQVQPLRPWIRTFGLQNCIPCPPESLGWDAIPVTLPLDMPSIRIAIGPANLRLLLIAYWAAILLIGLLAVFSLTAIVEVDTRRKVFHGVMVAMMLPSTFIDPCACALALALILAVFLLLEIIRAGQVPPLGISIGRFVAPYVDGRDLRGPVVVSHIFLLIGCAMPLWFSLVSIARAGSKPWKDWDLQHNKREVAMIAGVVCVGMGDAAASLVGRRYGKHKWPWVGGKSLEGSAAFAAAVTIGLMVAKAWLVLGGWNDNIASLAGHTGSLGTWSFAIAWHTTMAKAVFCACSASFMEAVLTGANDNVVVPVALWLLVKGVKL